jgi:hypothetical protein
MKTKSFKKCSCNLLLLCISVFAAFFLAEGIVRLFFPQNTNPSYQVPDPYVLRKGRPNSNYFLKGRTNEFFVTVTTNSHGWRGEELDQRPKIMTLGDSFTFGFPVSLDKTYPSIMESFFARNGFELQVVNLGQVDRGPDQYWADYHYNKEVIKPMLITIGFYEKNDFIISSSIININESGKLNFVRYEPSDSYSILRIILQGRTYDLLSQYSHFCTLLQTGIFYITHWSELDNYRANRSLFAEKQQQYKGHPPYPKMLAFTLKIFQGLLIEAQNDNVPVVFFVIPEEYPHIYTSILLQELKNNGAHVVDLRKEFEKRGLKNFYYSRDDDHWNEYGHALAAKLLTEYILTNNLIESQ